MKRYPNWLDHAPACWYPSRYPNAIGGDRHGTRPQVKLTHGPVRCGASQLGTLATVNHHCCWVGSPRPAHSPLGGWALAFPCGPGRWCATHGRAQMGQTVSGPAAGWPCRRSWPWRQGRFSPRRSLSHVVRLACERPDWLDRSLSQWDCAELARQLVADGLVAAISAATIRRILAAHQLKPWRHHLWLYPTHPQNPVL